MNGGMRIALMMVTLAFPLRMLAQEPNLCTPKEEAIFTCTLESRKIVSACAVLDGASEAPKSIAYRYGEKDAVELTIPHTTFPQDMRVSEIAAKPYSKVTEDDQYLRFIKGQYSYIIYTADSYQFDLAGLAVFKGATLLKNETCQSGNHPIQLSFNTLLSLGIQDDLDADKFWRSLLPKTSAVFTQPSEMQ